mgnify:CR=1 FL=1
MKLKALISFAARIKWKFFYSLLVLLLWTCTLIVVDKIVCIPYWTAFLNLKWLCNEEWKVKIGVDVQMQWEKRCKKLNVAGDLPLWVAKSKLQKLEEGVFLVRRSFSGTHKLLDEKLEERVGTQSIEERKKTPRSKSSKRAPKYLEKRRKISESISTKWADLVKACPEELLFDLFSYFAIENFLWLNDSKSHLFEGYCI